MGNGCRPEARECARVRDRWGNLRGRFSRCSEWGEQRTDAGAGWNSSPLFPQLKLLVGLIGLSSTHRRPDDQWQEDSLLNFFLLSFRRACSFDVTEHARREWAILTFAESG